MTAIQCTYCERRCKLEGVTLGYCRLYQEREGAIVERFPHRYSSMFVNHIENIPFYHFQPGSRTFALGGAGCNLDCQYCSNAYVARSEPEPLLSYSLSPERVVTLAEQYGCHNLAYAINEPTVAMPTLLEVAATSERAGLPLSMRACCAPPLFSTWCCWGLARTGTLRRCSPVRRCCMTKLKPSWRSLKGTSGSNGGTSPSRENGSSPTG